MGNTATYHNVRDKSGRFAPKSSKTPTKRKAKPSKKVSSKGKEIYDMFILDKSSSMSSIKEATINGYNEILNGIKKVCKDTKVPSYCSLVEFSNNFNVKSKFLNTDCEKTSILTNSTYLPGGMTALYDAIGLGITSLKENLASKLNSNISVTVSILTDGEENNSTKYNKQSTKALIEEMKDKYNWTINFIGAGEEKAVKSVADSIGIFASNTASYKATNIGTQSAFSNISNARSKKSVDYASRGVNTNIGFFSND